MASNVIDSTMSWVNNALKLKDKLSESQSAVGVNKNSDMPRETISSSNASSNEYYMDDQKYSERLANRLAASSTNVNKIQSDEVIGDLTGKSYNNTTSKQTGSEMNIYSNLYHANNIRHRDEIYGGKNYIFNYTYRFGTYNPYGQISTAREYVFFTKPDLHILYREPDTGTVRVNQLNAGLESYFWKDLKESKSRIIECLQSSYCKTGMGDPFNHLLQNTLNSNLEVPSLNAPSIETSTNTFGVSLTYRGSSEESDDGPEFSLEFKDDRYLNVYTFFRAYEEYETLKKHGVIKPYKDYILNKVLHDQFAVYKFIVDEDMETIIYWGKYYGVYPTSLPRDAFNSDNFADGLTFSINFKAAFYEDMRPEILYDFNNTAKPMFDICKYRIDVCNDVFMRADGRAAKSAMVYRVENDKRASLNPNKYYYKLVWRGDETT